MYPKINLIEEIEDEFKINKEQLISLVNDKGEIDTEKVMVRDYEELESVGLYLEEVDEDDETINYKIVRDSDNTLVLIAYKD
jgi:hypothetical protein